MEGGESTSEETPVQQQREEPTETEGPSTEVPLSEPTPKKTHHKAHVENHSSSHDQYLASGERKRIQRIQSRWRKIGPLLRANATSSLLPLRRLRLVIKREDALNSRKYFQVQHRRRLLHKDSEQTSHPTTFRPQHAASADRKTLPTTRITESPTTTKTTATTRSSTTQKPRQLRTGGAPRARQMASENGAGRHRVAPAAATDQGQGGKLINYYTNIHNLNPFRSFRF